MFYFSKKQELVSFEDILIKLNKTEEEYILALRSTLKRAQVFLKRSSLEVNINCYNKTILHLFEANIDTQFVLEEYGIASYIINYVGKVDAGLSKLLRDASADASNGNTSVKEKFRKITNVFLNSNLMSAQEASYHVLSLPLSKSSRQTIYINTSPINERALMLKSSVELRKLNSDSTEIFMDDVMVKYANRPEAHDNVCLADFVSSYSKRKVRNNDNNINDDEIIEYRPRGKLAVIRYRRYKLAQDPVNYYREQILLFLPWRNEANEIENVDAEKVYNENLDTIDQNRQKYSVIGDDLLDKALENAQNEIQSIENSEIDSFVDDELSANQKIDILEQDGKEISKNKFFNRFVCPKRVSDKELIDLMAKLNGLQREFVMHVLKCYKTNKLPLKIFLSGSAGVGKSTVINCINQLITSYFDHLPGSEKDKLVVLLCAPSGKAAFIINGVTLHTAFALPVVQFGGQMPELSTDLANNIREKLFHLKLLVIDEISMVGSTLLSRVDTRLRQIRGINKPFGDVSVIVVGDLNQLPPVMDSPIYKISKSNEMFKLFDTNPLWDDFEFFELTQIMRQKDEKLFIEALNNLAVGKMTEGDIELIKSRQVLESNVPESAIRLFVENVNVDNYNQLKIEKQLGTEYISEAKDIILGKVSDTTRKRVIESLKTKSITETNGLPFRVKLKLQIKYMISSNIDVEDGLVNGACGFLKDITFDPNSTSPRIIWIDFESSGVGNKVRLPYKEFMESEKIDKHLTPIVKTSITLNISNKLQYQIIRKQFPVVPAEALTIHKSQGQTYKEICVDFNKSKRITRSMLYVALSRVTKLSGLYILGTFRPPKSAKLEDPVLKELHRLRTERKLKLAFDNLEEVDVITIIYQNINSLSTKFKLILKDPWYRKGDILIFTETMTNSTEKYDIPDFVEIFRSNVQRSSRGVICFSKKPITVSFTDHVLNIQDNKNKCGYHVELFGIKIDKYCIISGYKSPSCPNRIFEQTFQNIVNKSYQKDNELIVIGDFNFDMKSARKTDLFKMFQNYNLTSALSSEISTTDLNTQIDVIFSTSASVKTGVYETYFSYHKPVFVKFGRENSNSVSTGKIQISPSVVQNTISSDIQISPSVVKNTISSGMQIPPSVVQNTVSSDYVTIHSDHEDNANEIDIVQTNSNKSNCITINSDHENNSNNFESVLPRLNKVYIETVLNSEGYLDDNHIDEFGKILAETTDFRPQSVLFLQNVNYITPVPEHIDNIQILFSGPTNSVGHWICTYMTRSTLHVYDSLNNKCLNADHITYLSKLYEFDYTVVFHNVQQQTNLFDCGVYSIAFATSICFDKEPDSEIYDITKMRKRVAQILTTRCLLKFPVLNT